MKKVLLCLSLLSNTTFAQEALKIARNETPVIRVSFEKLVLTNDNMTLSKSDHGDLDLIGDSIHVSGPVNVDMHVSKTKKDTKDAWLIVADKIRISGIANPLCLKANRLRYNDKTKTALLTGNIVIIENGIEKKAGQHAELDLKNGEFKIVSIK